MFNSLYLPEIENSLSYPVGARALVLWKRGLKKKHYSVGFSLRFKLDVQVSTISVE